ncbi:MAG TPA: cell surface protein SprA [Bacteroidales bacterium]|nr:cell surface protein SprA [Bacteroidales bacterium]
MVRDRLQSYRYPLIIILLLLIRGCLIHIPAGAATVFPFPFLFPLPPDTNVKGDTTLRYPFSEENTLPGGQGTSNMYLKNPSNLNVTVEYDPVTRQYVYVYKIGTLTYRIPTTLSFDEYQDEDMQTMLKNYWRERAEAASIDNNKGIIPKIHIGGKVFETIFGNNTVDIRPQGSAEITFGLVSNRRDDPMLNTQQRRQTNFDFNEKIQMNVIAKIGDKIEFKTSYNSEATFDFENKLKLKYEGKEDDIIQLIEGGDVNLPLNSTLIKGNESLFGIKAKLRFGRVTVTAIYSQQKSETKTINVQGNAQTTNFSIHADEYEENRHFFIAQYFRSHYKGSLKTLPVVTSNVNIVKMEVWVTNVGAAVTDNRNIVAFQDLGEYTPYNTRLFHGTGNGYPSNNANNLFQVIMPTPADTVKVRNINLVTDYLKGSPFFMVSGEDFEKVESARKLLPSEYSYNPKLGFISLNTALNPDQVLGVAFQYQVVGDTTIYQVGEFSDQGINVPKCLIVKLLKSTSLNTRLPMWNLMMKNVYSLGAYQIQQQDFTLNILYSGNKNGVPTAYIAEGRISGVPLLRVLSLDNLDQQGNPPSDGMFDFIDNAVLNGGTIQASNGRIYFPVLEPFGKDLRDSIFDPMDPTGSMAIADKYCFDSLYTMTKTMAKQYTEKNKFTLDGFFKSSTGSEISLNALNVPQGSVKVTAGGVLLTENVDYTVDYTLGRVRIINQGLLNSGTPIQISLESTQMFNIQTKRLMGAHFDYKINKDFIIGGTILNLNERPLTQKVNYGDEPISNTVWGLNLSYRNQSRLITRLVDLLPLISTKAPSNVAVDAEFAQFIPGHSKSIGQTGTSYIDDFEGARSTIDLKNVGTWFLASTPQGQVGASMFPEGAPGTGLAYGFNRAKLAWYVIDPLFYDRNTNLIPPNVNNNELSNNYVRQVWETEVFPNKEPLNGVPVNLAVLNLAYYPYNVGPYNFDVSPGPFSAGLSSDGTLASPESRWGGIMRKMETTDFDATNIQYIEFWMMDPFSYDSTISGDLYFNLGDISEDILRDGRKSYENGLPTSSAVTNVDTTIWGRVPSLQSLVDAFDNDPNARPYQDVGYDGLMDADERTFFDTTYLERIKAAFGQNSNAYTNALQDPSSDDYHYFRGTDYDNNSQFSSILERYKKFNGPDGNSPSSANNPESYPTLATTLPNVEDINKDNTLSETERYYQYVVHLRPEMMKTGQNYITNVYHATGIQLANGSKGDVRWYQFKIPVRSPDKVVGNISDFTSIRFMRMFFKGFNKSVVCRFATMELSRGEWRKYTYDLLSPGEYIPDDNENQTAFDIATVSIEENGSKQPIPYVLPPGIERETNWGSTNQQQFNEQSMVLKVCNLIDGDARAAYKTCQFDFRQFKRLKMFVHAEQSIASQSIKNGDLTVFIRIGSDFTENYYEYEIPLTFTPWGTKASQPDLIWPEANSFDISLERLVNVKYDRIVAMAQSGNTASLSTPYVEYDGKNKITVIGSPTISDVKAVMIGVRNPKKGVNSPDDDGQAKCAEIWVDELRLTDFNKEGGVAATARISADLADFGRIQLSGSYSSAGWGTIEQSQTERQLESITSLGFDTDLELGKFFPEKSGVRIPMHFDYSMVVNTPKYDPLNPDILYKNVLKAFPSKTQKDSVRNTREDYTQRKNFNFINIRKDRTKDKKIHVYDIENFTVSYAYSEIFHRDIDVAYDLSKKYTGGIGYNYAAVPKNIVPFQNNKYLNKHRSLRLIRDFNFYYLPKSFSFRTDMDREYNERMLRNKSSGIVPMATYYNKIWNWTRLYDLKWDLAKSIKVTFLANENAYVNEPPGKIDTRSEKDQVWGQIFSFGTMNNYNQKFNITYDLPFSKIFILDWINISAGYEGIYHWTATPISVQAQFGNTIENGNTKVLNGGFSFLSLYNKIPYLKRINSTDITSQKKGGQKGEPMKKDDQLPKQPNAKADSLQAKKSGFNFGKFLLDGTLRLLMCVRKASFSYTQGNGTALPGFTPVPNALGNDWSQNAPGLGFIFGDQKDVRNRAIYEHWMTLDTLQNNAYMNKFNENLTINVSIEPFRDFKIEVNAVRTYSFMHSEYFRADENGSFAHEAYSPTDAGSFTMSYIMIGTSFSKDNADNTSPLFETMKNYRLQVAHRYAAENPWSTSIVDSTGYPYGYGPTDQEVLTTAFLASYTGRNPDKISLKPFPTIPLPNWRITYDGLMKIKGMKKIFRTLTLSHAYLCTYTVGSFVSNIQYKEADGYPTVVDNAGNFIPKEQFSVISVTEQFNPLIKVDMSWVNSLLTNLEWRRSRNISFSFVNNQMTEVSSNEFVVGLGYRFKNVRLSFISLGAAGRKSKYANDLNLKLDFSLRRNKTVLRRLEDDVNQISAGQQVMSIDFTADYNLSQRFSIRFYFDKVINSPYISNQYRTSNTKGGLTLRFTLAQ